MDLVALHQKLWTLQQARAAVLAELAPHIEAGTADVACLARLRTSADAFARQADSLVAAMRERNLSVAQIRLAEDLRLFFRAAVGCSAGMLDSGAGERARRSVSEPARGDRGRRPDPEPSVRGPLARVAR